MCITQGVLLSLLTLQLRQLLQFYYFQGIHSQKGPFSGSSPSTILPTNLQIPIRQFHPYSTIYVFNPHLSPYMWACVIFSNISPYISIYLHIFPHLYAKSYRLSSGVLLPQIGRNLPKSAILTRFAQSQRGKVRPSANPKHFSADQKPQHSANQPDFQGK